MKKLDVTGKNLRELNREEEMAITGGDDTNSYLKCVSATMTTGGGGIRSFVLGVTLFGMSRLCGVIVGYSSL